MEASIQWFPGHMTKAIRKIKEQLKIIDLIVYVLDARLPNLSYSPVLGEIAKDKKVIFLLNKSDLADQSMTDAWVRHYREKGVECFRHTATNVTGNSLRKYLFNFRDKLLTTKKHRIYSPLRIMVLGIPNVGKSSFINGMVGQKSAKTANKPGVTKGNQWLRVLDGIDLLDTPGVLMPKITCRNDGMLLALCGAIRDGIVDEETLLADVATPLLCHKDSVLLDSFRERYLEGFDSTDGHEFLHYFARKNGYLGDNSQVNSTNAAQRCIAEFRKGYWGNLTFEKTCNNQAKNIFHEEFWQPLT